MFKNNELIDLRYEWYFLFLSENLVARVDLK